MIKLWEIHLETRDTISDMLNKLKAKGLSFDYKLMCDKNFYSKLMVKHPKSGEIYSYGIKLYTEIDSIYIYEICAWTEQEYSYLIELANSI